MDAAFSQAWVNLRTSASSGARSRSCTSMWNAPPASTGLSCAQSPTRTTLAPALRACSVRVSRAKVPASEASSTTTSCPDRSDHFSTSALRASMRLRSMDAVMDGPARCSLARSSSISRSRPSWRTCSVSHLLVFSVSTPNSSARTCAAAADGANPTTEPAPNCRSHTARRPPMVVDLPVPAGPTRTSRTRPEVAICSTARAWSTDSP